MEQQRVIHLINSGGFYGAERAVLEFCRASLGGAFSPILINFYDLRKPHLELHERAQKEGIPTRLLPCRSRLDFRTLRELRRLILLEKGDIIHCHGFKADFYGLLVGKSLKIPLITTIHGWTGLNMINRVYQFLDGLFLHFFDRVVALGEENRKKLIKFGVNPRAISIIPYGIHCDDPAQGPKRISPARFGLKEDDIVVGVIARLNLEKGHHHLLKAARIVIDRVPGVRFLLVGDGPLRSQLDQEVDALGLAESVIFAGFQSDMNSIYSLLDMVVLASLREGLPLTILEAMAAGLPVVATRVGEVHDVVRHGATGFLVEPGDEIGLAEAILELTKNPHRCAEMGNLGRRLIEDRFGSARMGENYTALYAEVIRGRLGKERYR